MQIAILAICFALMASLAILVYRTPLGTAMRATAQNAQVAGLMGIDINRVIAVTFVIGAGLGAVAGVLYGTYYGIAQYTMGSILGLKAFSAAVLGASATFRAPCSAACCSAGRGARRGLYRRFQRPLPAACRSRLASAAATSSCSARNTRTCSPSWC